MTEEKFCVVVDETDEAAVARFDKLSKDCEFNVQMLKLSEFKELKIFCRCETCLTGFGCAGCLSCFRMDHEGRRYNMEYIEESRKLREEIMALPALERTEHLRDLCGCYECVPSWCKAIFGGRKCANPEINGILR